MNNMIAFAALSFFFSYFFFQEVAVACPSSAKLMSYGDVVTFLKPQKVVLSASASTIAFRVDKVFWKTAALAIHLTCLIERKIDELKPLNLMKFCQQSGAIKLTLFTYW